MKAFEKLDNFLEFGWAQLFRGKADKKSPARHPTFVTSSEKSFPNARTLVMRRIDRKDNQIEFHTDTASSKMDVLVDVKVGDITIPNWRNVPTNSRIAYGITPSPGTIIKSPFAYDQTPDQRRFAVLICHIQSIQLLLLGIKHIRAYYEKKTNWRGEWLSP